MEKETALPKNIRQIGEVRGEEKICLEDYVMTCIHKKEQQEKEGYLGIFFGERRREAETEYVFIRGILELSKTWEPESFAEKLEKQRTKYFPDWTVQGCCVIGVYDMERIREVRTRIEDAGHIVYHLQEQEETLYAQRDGTYHNIKGYFIFYEQNEEMQAYMIAEREQSRPADVEEERVMEAINARREKRKAEAAADAARGTTASGASTPNTARSATASRASAPNTASGRKTVLSRLGALKAAAPTLNAASRKTAFGTAYQARSGSTGALFPKLCRIGCLVLLLVLVGTALTSVNQYSDMKAVSALLAGAVRNTKNETENISPGLIVEETVGWNSSDEMAQSAALDEATQADDTTGTDNAAMDGEATDNRTTDSVMPESVMPDSVMPDSVMSDSVTTDSVTTDSVMADGQNAVTIDADAESSTARQSASASDSSPQVQEALARPESYQVQKGDSLIAISRRFYGTDEKVIEICRLNNIKDPNQIQPGQNILLPSK